MLFRSETLERLRANRTRMAIGSSSKNTDYILQRTDLLKYFDAVVDGNNITKSKPDPEVFLKAAQFMGANPADCVVIEDAEAGIRAAKAAGMYAVGIGEAAGYSETDLGIKDMREIQHLVSFN